MNKSSTLLPVVMVIVIVFVTLVVMLSGRSNAPDVAGDLAYPHHVCTFNRYCAGSECNEDGASFVAYLAHADGQPRVEIAGMNPRATLVETPQSLVFESLGGTLNGTLTIHRDRKLDFAARTSEAEGSIDHFGSGSCDRRKTP